MRLSRETARVIATMGRFGVIWLPVYALLVPDVQPLSVAIGASLLLSVVWFLAMRAAFAAGRLTMLTLGPPVAAGVGTATGLVAASGAALWIPTLALGQLDVIQMAFAIFVFSAIWESLILRSVAARQRVLVVGAEDGGAELVEELQFDEGLPFEVVGIVDDERESAQIAGTPLWGRIDDLEEIVEAQRPDLVVLASGHTRVEAFDHLLNTAGAGFRVVGLPEFYELAFGRVPVQRVSAAWFMTVLSVYHRPYNRFAKRAFDVVVASIGLLLTAPLLPVLALLVKRSSPGPVIFKQQRPGENGRKITVYKFRTMRNDVVVPEGAALTEEDDPRITRVGRVMRKRRLDELPQLVNVLKGDMSIVGPRPEPDFVQGASEGVPHWIRRRMVKPGITGWAQIRLGYTGSDYEGVSKKLSYDLWYLRHRSLVVDLAICVKTFTTLASGSGAK